MPITRPDIPYSGAPSVTTQSGGEGGGDYDNARATPEAFGAGVGQAVEKAGEEGFNTTQHFQQMATDAKVNDDFANKYAPAAANLRAQYDTLRGPDKVAGYDNYIAGLQDLNKHFTSDGSEMYQKQMGGLIDRHVSNEIDGAKREMVASQIQYEDTSHFQKMKADLDLTLQNSSSPAALNQVNDTTDASTLKQHIDIGHAPDSPVVEEAQRQIKADNATAFISKNIATGNLADANQIRAEQSAVLPAYQRTQIDDTLHVANIQQTANASVSALKLGQPLPHAVGAPPTQVQAMVADGASTAGVDANHALAVLRIESSNGQNLGKNPDRMSIGQDKESSGQPLDVQISTLCKNLKQADAQASAALGRKADGWESYAVYQQGAGGGAALLKADPNAKAVDILRPLYGSNKEALSAITNNGGNASMTTEDFLGTIRDTYSKNAARAKCDLPADNAGSAILAPHNTAGQTVQPAATPTQALLNYDDKAQMPGGYLDQIRAIPNISVRQGVMAAYKADRSTYADQASAYVTNLANKAGQLAADPKFTSMDQVPPDMMAALASDHPQTITMLEGRADYNAKKSSGIAPPDNSAGTYQTFHDMTNGTITNIGQLQERVWRPGDDPKDPTKISIPMYDKLSAQLLKKSTTPDEARQQNAMFTAAQDILAKDKQIYPSAIGAIDKLDGELQAKGIPASERYAGIDNKNSVLHALDPFIAARDTPQAIADSLAKVDEDKPSVFSLIPGHTEKFKIISDFQSGKYSGENKAAGETALKQSIMNGLDAQTAKDLAVAYGYAKAK